MKRLSKSVYLMLGSFAIMAGMDNGKEIPPRLWPLWTAYQKFCKRDPLEAICGNLIISSTCAYGLYEFYEYAKKTGPGFADYCGAMALLSVGGGLLATTAKIYLNIYLGKKHKHAAAALFHAAEFGDTALAQKALSIGAQVNKLDFEGLAPLHYCLLNGHLGVAQQLKEYGADIEISTSDGDSPLVLLARSKNTIDTFAGFTWLLQHSANTEKRNYKGLASIHYLCKREKLDHLKVLCEAGADLDALSQEKYNLKRTALHIAIEKDFFPGIKLLAFQGADVNLPDESGETPLHWAAYHNKPHIISHLQEMGAQEEKKNEAGLIPLFYVAADSESAKLLQPKKNFNLL